MKPVEFPGCNVVFGKDQEEYQPLPALLVPGPHGEVVTCWEFTDAEIAEIFRTKKMYISQFTFLSPFQPILPTVGLDDNVELKA